jgi:probable F420-dependent oxidoreductase
MSERVLDELGFYLLAGAGGEGPQGPAALMTEARRGEEMGFGTAFISERWNVKEADALSGAACAVTDRIQIATAATNHNSRHPMITASWATTLHRLSNGRFTLGIGRGIGPLHQLYGMPPITTAQMEEFAILMRRLWNGEMVVGYDGKLGKYGFLHLDSSFSEKIPLGIVAFGDNTLKLGGRLFDDVILHTYFAPETVAHCVKTVKDAAEQAGRDPADVKVWSCLATVGDHLPEPVRRTKLVARLATYLQGYGDLMVQTNGWDPAVLSRFREDDVVRAMPGAIDAKATDDQLQHIETILPAEWMQVAATGSPQQCVTRIRQEFDYGADRVILHGASPDELAPIVAAYRASDGATA